MKKAKIYQPFRFKQFTIQQNKCAMKIGTDGVLLGAWCKVDNCNTVLDIGMGCGLIAIMLAQRCPAIIYGIEIDQATFEEANQNMQCSPWAKRLVAIHDSIQNYMPYFDVRFDLIVCNPPFFKAGTLPPQVNRSKVRHTITLSYSAVLSAAQQLLSLDGRLCLILPLQEGQNCIQDAKRFELHCTKLTHVKSRTYGKTERLLMQFEKSSSQNIFEDELIIYEKESNHYTNNYTNLTKSFYLYM